MVGIASSGTARRARGSGGLPFYGRTRRYERRKCAAVLRGAEDGAWRVSRCRAWWVRVFAWALVNIPQLVDVVLVFHPLSFQREKKAGGAGKKR